MRRAVLARHLFTARAAAGIWRPRDSCSTEAALRLMRRMVVAGHLFTPRASPGVWRPRDSCSTEAALRLMRLLMMAAHRFTSRAAKDIWRSRDSCSTEVALLMQPVATLRKSSNFCRSEATMYAARWGNSRVVSLFEVLSAPPPTSFHHPPPPHSFHPSLSRSQAQRCREPLSAVCVYSGEVFLTFCRTGSATSSTALHL